MGCMAIRKTKGFTERWCDGEQDVIDDWIEKKFGKIEILDNERNEQKRKDIFYKILHNKTLFNQGYNLVKKDFHAEGEPKRNMTEYEFIYHLNFGLGTPVRDELPGFDFRHPMQMEHNIGGWFPLQNNRLSVKKKSPHETVLDMVTTGKFKWGGK